MLMAGKGCRMPRPLGPKEIDTLLVPLDKAYTLLTDNLITVLPLRYWAAQEQWFQVKLSMHINLMGGFQTNEVFFFFNIKAELIIFIHTRSYLYLKCVL